jgi:hypothetical protein
MKLRRNDNKFFISKKDIFYVVDQTLNNTNDITVIIPNAIGLNNSGNSKFSNILYKKFPSIKDNIELSNNQQKNQIICANMFCKHPKNKYNRIIDYGALASCMLQVRTKAKVISNDTDKKIQIHSPKFGTGFAGGDWKTISNLINDIWARDFTCFIYEPTNV